MYQRTNQPAEAEGQVLIWRYEDASIKENILLCGGTIGHRPLRGRCPKTTITKIATTGPRVASEDLERALDELARALEGLGRP